VPRFILTARRYWPHQVLLDTPAEMASCDPRADMMSHHSAEESPRPCKISQSLVVWRPRCDNPCVVARDDDVYGSLPKPPLRECFNVSRSPGVPCSLSLCKSPRLVGPDAEIPSQRGIQLLRPRVAIPALETRLNPSYPSNTSNHRCSLTSNEQILSGCSFSWYGRTPRRRGLVASLSSVGCAPCQD
jgi:hypothetical protein